MPTLTAKRSISAIALFAMVGSASCKSEPRFVETPLPAPDAGVDAALPPPPPADAAPPPAQPGPCDAVQTLAFTTMFQGRAPGEAPGMQPHGAPVCGIVPEGQSVSSQTVMLEQGFCYTFLGQALPTVTEVDMQLELDLAAGGLPPALAALAVKPVLAVDSDAGPQTAIGAKQSCYAWPWPVPGVAKLVVKARTGTGPVAAQVYKKKK